jgi:hypothetical protein
VDAAIIAVTDSDKRELCGTLLEEISEVAAI